MCSLVRFMISEFLIVILLHTSQAHREPEGPVDHAKAAQDAKVHMWHNDIV